MTLTRPLTESPSPAGSRSLMSQPRRLRTSSPFSVDTIARKPSHFTSKV